jgi:cysteinyl-tRNA synthetase
MSKSLGNFFTIRDILEKYDGEVVRFFLISSHYRSHVSYMDNSLDEAHSKLERFYNALQEANVGDAADIDNEYSQRFHAAMDDDFNTPEAIAALFDLVREVNKTTGEEQQALAGQLKYLGGVLGCLQADPQTFLQAGAGDDAAWIEEMIAKRIAAKKAKDFATADAVRDELVAKGIVLKDGPEGTVWTKS